MSARVSVRVGSRVGSRVGARVSARVSVRSWLGTSARGKVMVRDRCEG